MKDFKDFLIVLTHVLIGTYLLYLFANGSLLAIVIFTLWMVSTLIIKINYLNLWN